MVIVDTFIFSEPREKEQLLTKLTLGSEVVTEWVLAENAYTFRGEHKGLHARALLESDPRFGPFRDRIVVISREEPFPEVQGTDAHGDRITFPSQYAQRDFVADHLREKWGHRADAWLMVSDADECLDVSTPQKRDRVQRWLTTPADIVPLDRVRFWFDIDNVWPAKRYTPLVRMRPLCKWLGPGRSLGAVRGPMLRDIASAGLTGVMYEYSNCIELEGVYRKYDTVGHVGMRHEDLRVALACNHRPVFHVKGQQLTVARDDWMTRVRLTEHNSPAYVRENFARLKTGNIAENYLENRRRHYPEFTSIRGSLARRKAAWLANAEDFGRSLWARVRGNRFPELAGGPQ